MINLYHQMGHNHNWNLESLEDDGTADGLILAPRYMDRAAVTSLDPSLRQRSIFDPQFFMPGSTRGKLPTYEFFPDVVANGFATAEYDESTAKRSAELCLAFQISNDFRYCVIPTRFMEGSPSNFIQVQRSLFVDPFLECLAGISRSQPLLLQLILTDQMIKDQQFSDDILNWVTGIQELQGVYLIPFLASRQKQIQDIDYLTSLFKLIAALRENDLQVILGYQNTESFLMLAVDPTAVTMGSYENLRMFNPKAFDDEEGEEVRTPKARIYIPRLLQWVDNQYLRRILDFVDDPLAFLGTSAYNDLIFDPYYKWHFSKPDPYKHYFVVYSRQLLETASFDLPDRVGVVYLSCESAIKEFERLESKGIRFHPDSGKDHLYYWLTALSSLNN